MATKYDSRFDKLEVKFDKIDSRMDDLQVILTKQQSILDEHIRRTELLESALAPLKAQQNQIVGAGKLIALVVALCTIGTFILKIAGKI